MHNSHEFTPIAIVSMACRLPGAGNVDGTGGGGGGVGIIHLRVPSGYLTLSGATISPAHSSSMPSGQ